jgi:hypothetical protein
MKSNLPAEQRAGIINSTEAQSGLHTHTLSPVLAEPIQDGKPRFRIRNLPDGTQQRLAVDSDEVLGTFGPNPEKGKLVHYHRQSDEKVVLVPGEPQQAEIVRRMFKMKLVEGKGSFVISKTLNDEGIRTGTNRLWSTASVDDILDNPTYTGVGISERYATGIYHTRGNKAAPKPVKRTLRTVARRKKTDINLRPREDWRLHAHPHLVNYLDDSLRELAIVHQEKLFAKQAQKALAPKKKQKPGGDSHGDSPYILKDILRSKQGNHPMTGCLAGPPKYRTRYYRVTRAQHAPISGSPLSTMIRAEPLEMAVMDVVKQVLLDVPNLRQQIARAHREDCSALDSDREQIAPLVAERDAIQANLVDAFEMGPASRKLIKHKMEQWEARLAVLEERIGQAEAVPKAPAIDMEAFTAAAVKRLNSAAQLLQAAKPAVVRSVLSHLISNLEIDLETRAVTMELMLPDGVKLHWDAKTPLCPVPPRQSPWGNEAQWTHGLKIAEITCEGVRGSWVRPACFTCSRKAA